MSAMFYFILKSEQEQRFFAINVYVNRSFWMQYSVSLNHACKQWLPLKNIRINRSKLEYGTFFPSHIEKWVKVIVYYDLWYSYKRVLFSVHVPAYSIHDWCYDMLCKKNIKLFVRNLCVKIVIRKLNILNVKKKT